MSDHDGALSRRDFLRGVSAAAAVAAASGLSTAVSRAAAPAATAATASAEKRARVVLIRDEAAVAARFEGAAGTVTGAATAEKLLTATPPAQL